MVEAKWTEEQLSHMSGFQIQGSQGPISWMWLLGGHNEVHMPILASPPPHFSSFDLREKMSLSDFEGLSEHELNTLHIALQGSP